VSDGPFGRRDPAPPHDAAPAKAEPPPVRPAPPRPPARASTYTWILGVVVILALAYITLNTFKTEAPGSRGVTPGKPLPPFSMVLATSTRTCEVGGDARPCDANVAAKPGSGAEGRRPACEVRAPDLLNSCELAERGPVALAFVATGSQRCEDQVDVMQEVKARHPAVQFAAVAVRGDVAALRRTIRERGWTIPVGYDHDGAVSNLYAVGICPTITFARRGGRVESTSLGRLDAPALERRLRAIGG
jgi:hypothetical protein